jgi:hypothetical protein
VQVSRLRKKIETCCDEAPIKTVRNAGCTLSHRVEEPDMLGHLGFVGRLLGIVLLVILALVALIAGALFASRMRAVDTPPRRPLPEQAPAIVALLEEAEPARRMDAVPDGCPGGLFAPERHRVDQRRF